MTGTEPWCPIVPLLFGASTLGRSSARSHVPHQPRFLVVSSLCGASGAPTRLAERTRTSSIGSRGAATATANLTNEHGPRSRPGPSEDCDGGHIKFPRSCSRVTCPRASSRRAWRGPRTHTLEERCATIPPSLGPWPSSANVGATCARVCRLAQESADLGGRLTPNLCGWRRYGRIGLQDWPILTDVAPELATFGSLYSPPAAVWGAPRLSAHPSPCIHELTGALWRSLIQGPKSRFTNQAAQRGL